MLHYSHKATARRAVNRRGVTIMVTTQTTQTTQEDGLSPFANLEQTRILNACKRDRAFQDSVYRLHYCAKVIIHHYYSGKFTMEEAIALLALYCKRSRKTAIVNIQNSRYANYTAEQLKHIF